MLHFPIKFVNIFFSFFTFLHFLVGCTIRMYLRGFPEIQTKEDVTNISFHPTLSSTPGPPVPIHAKRNVWSRLQNWLTLSNLKIEKECWPQQVKQKKKKHSRSSSSGSVPYFYHISIRLVSSTSGLKVFLLLVGTRVQIKHLTQTETAIFLFLNF